jgi:hypothetical protein
MNRLMVAINISIVAPLAGSLLVRPIVVPYLSFIPKLSLS